MTQTGDEIPSVRLARMTSAELAHEVAVLVGEIGCCTRCEGHGQAPDGPCTDCLASGHAHAPDSNCQFYPRRSADNGEG